MLYNQEIGQILHNETCIIPFYYFVTFCFEFPLFSLIYKMHYPLTTLTQFTLIYKEKCKIKLHCYQYFEQIKLQNDKPRRNVLIVIEQ